MENLRSQNEDYENILKKNRGLLQVNCKIPVKDRTALAQVYTPGVGFCCKLIEKYPQKVYELTNKKNACIVISDGSELGLRPEEVYPYLEAFCAYYKISANIDAYPIIIDGSLIKNSEDFQATVKAIMPAFSFIEFFGIKENHLKGFCSEGKFSFLNSNHKRKIDDILIKSDLNINISSNLIFAGIIRASLDLQTYHSLNECVDFVIKQIVNGHNKNIKQKSCLGYLIEIIKFASQFLIDKNKINNIKPENICSRTQAYFIQGKSAWIEEYPINFLSKNRTINENSVLLHRRYHGVVETATNFEVKSLELLNELLSWTNIDKISSLINKDISMINSLTCRGNMGAIITNGTAILGFGDIGAVAGLPVMEGKCVLFKLFGGTNVMPFCIQEKNSEVFISIVQKISKSFCAINLEDIKAPECFEIESKLIETIPYPVFHDDQHGTAIVVTAGIINALRLAKKQIEDVKIVMNGAGAAGLSVTELLITHGAKNIIICDTVGAIYTGRPKNMNTFKEKLAKLTNPNRVAGSLSEVLKNSDIFIGVSAPKTLTQDMIKSMNKNPIIFALANPEPEIYPKEAKEAGAFIVATGRSDFDNQVNNSLAFPGIFRAAIDVRARKISIKMKIAASIAIANLIQSDRLNPNYIIPDSLDSKVPVAVAYAVAKEALGSGLAENKETNADEVEHNLIGWMLEEKMRNWEYIKLSNLEFIENDLKPKSKF